jgi:hypothetical protein
MGTQLWVRNPSLCIRECLELGVSKFTWDRGLLKRKGIDLQRFMELYYGPDRPWEAMLIGPQGASLVNRNRGESDPAAVYPVWVYGDEWEKLEELVASPVGDDPWKCGDAFTDPELRPRRNQAHVVVITYTPDAKTSVGKQFYMRVQELQQANPDCTIHVHGLYSYRVIFGLEFGSVDTDPRSLAANGKITLPNGKEVTVEQAVDFQHWITMFGWTLGDMRVPRNRCLYNIKSAEWAAAQFRENVKFHYKGFEHIDPDNPMARQRGPRRGTMVRRVRPLHTDKFLCDTCSLQSDCQFFRVGAVCAVPGSDPTALSEFFKTRDADSIVQGLLTLAQTEAVRVGEARQAEVDKEEINPEVTKMIDKLFKHGLDLVKITDPAFRPAHQQGNVNNGTQVFVNTSPQELMAGIVEELVRRGIPRGEITPDMVMQIVQAPEALREKAVAVAVAEKAIGS